MKGKIGACHSLIVAEISANHHQNFNKAVLLIKEAKKSGADAVKFQTYTPDTLTIDINNKYFMINHPKWCGQTLYQLYKKAYTPWSWFKKLKKISDDMGMLFFSTAFDKTAVDFLEELGVTLHKVASFELTDLSLIEYMAKTKKPILLSTGMASSLEIKEAVGVARRAGARDITLLKCVSSYPAKAIEMNLRTIPDMHKRFKCPIGISDHTLGIAVPLAAVALGATMIEKHFTLSRKVKGPDSFFSIEPNELKDLVANTRIVEEALGKINYTLGSEQQKNKIFRRSLFAIENIHKGDVFTEKNIRSIRPGYGLPPKHLKKILGKKAKKEILRGSPLANNLIV